MTEFFWLLLRGEELQPQIHSVLSRNLARGMLSRSVTLADWTAMSRAAEASLGLRIAATTASVSRTKRTTIILPRIATSKFVIDNYLKID